MLNFEISIEQHQNIVVEGVIYQPAYKEELGQ